MSVTILCGMVASRPLPAADTVSFCFNDWPPYTESDGEAAGGVSVDILREAATRAGLQPSFTELPWNRCLDMVKKGMIDAVVDAAPRAEFRHGRVSHSVYTNTLWVRSDDPLTAPDIAGLGQRSIGLVAGYDYGEPLDSQLGASRVRKEFSKDDPTNIRKLGFGRVDVIISDLVTTRLFAMAHELKIRPLEPSLSYDRLYPSFHPARLDLLERMDAGLAAMMADGAIDTIYMKAVGVTLSNILSGIDG